MSGAVDQPTPTQNSSSGSSNQGLDRRLLFAMALIAGVLIATFLVYLPGLTGPLLLDDLPQLSGLIAQGASDQATLIRNYIVSTSGPLGRPVSMSTFIFDAVTHGPDIWWWKYNNVMFHLISGLLVFWLTALLVQATPRKIGVNSWLLGAIVAGLWLLHPLQVSTVLYVVQRMTELSTLFVLAGLVCYAKGRLIQTDSTIWGWFYIGLGFGLFYPLAIFSKEGGALFPVFCSLIEISLFQFRGNESVRRQMKMFHGVLLVGYLSVAVFVLANFSSIVLGKYELRDFTFVERVLTQFRVMVIYLHQILLPVQGNMGFFHDDIAASTGLLSPVTTLFSALVLIALAVSAYLLRKTLPLYTFGISFFLASHMLESTVFALEFMFEHRNYLGLFGILLAALSLISYATDNRKGLVIATVICLSGFSFLTWQRSLTWSEPIRMYEYMYYAHPESGRLNLTVSNIYALAGDFPRARQSLSKAGAGLGVDVHGRFLDCLQYQRVNEGAMSAMLQRTDGLVDGHATSSAQSLVGEVIGGGCKASFNSLLLLLDHLLASRARSVIDKQSIMFTKARLLASNQQVDAAVEILLAAQQLSARDALPLYLAASTYVDDGQPDEAYALLVRAFEMEKSTRIRRLDIAKATYLAVGKTHESLRRLEEALSVYARAISAMPTQSLFYLESARLLLQLQRYDDVRKLLEQMRERKLADIDQFDFELQRIKRSLQEYRDNSTGN